MLGSERVKRPTILNFIIEKSLSIGPLLPMLNQPRAHWILSDVVPFLVNRLRDTEKTIKSTRLPAALVRQSVKLVKPAFQPLKKRTNTQFAFERHAEQMDMIWHYEYAIRVPFIQAL